MAYIIRKYRPAQVWDCLQAGGGPCFSVSGMSDHEMRLGKIGPGILNSEPSLFIDNVSSEDVRLDSKDYNRIHLMYFTK